MDIDKINKKFFACQFLVITAGTVVGLYIYHNIIKKSQPQTLSLYSSSHLQYTPKVNHMSPNLDTENEIQNGTQEIPEPPKYKLEITTFEYDSENYYWIPTLTHVFYGNSQREIDQIISSHRQTDIFFDASFKGIFKWKGGEIQLKNITSNLMYS